MKRDYSVYLDDILDAMDKAEKLVDEFGKKVA